MQLRSIKEKWGFLSTHKVFVGCSGGVDSVVMLVALKTFCTDLEVLHVNYSLRGLESDGDEQFVRALCQKLAVPIHVKRVDTPALIRKNGGNLQELARNIRYSFFQEQLSKHEQGYVALGQHSDDQVETFFQHLSRKSGILGMSCMLENHNRYVRPLLSYSKSEILHFAKAYSLPWREDRSNYANKYTRNRLRNIVLPFLYAELPDLKEAVLTLVKTFQDTQKTNVYLAEKAIHTFKNSNLWGYVDFDVLEEDVRLEVLRCFGGDYSVYTELVKIRTAQKGKWVECGEYRVYKESDGFLFVLSKVNVDYLLVKEQVNELPGVFTKEEIYLDATKIQGELSVRIWEKGDRIFPIGMRGSKLISDVLTEAKVYTSARESCLVVVDAVSVLWCVGYKVSRKAIADEQSQKILKVQIVEK